MNDIEKKLNYTFKNKKLLIQALTHSSVSKTNNYEILEFLGDSIINYYSTIYLLEKYPNDNQADLSIKRAQIVNKKNLCKLSKTLNLFKSLKIEKKINISEKMHCDIFEAIIGAIYKDSNIIKTSTILEKLFNKYIKLNNLKKHYDYKGLIISFKKKNKLKNLNLKTHYDKECNFFVTKLIYNGMVFYGFSSNKKTAEKRCSEITFKNLDLKL